MRGTCRTIAGNAIETKPSTAPKFRLDAQISKSSFKILFIGNRDHPLVGSVVALGHGRLKFPTFPTWRSRSCEARAPPLETVQMRDLSGRSKEPDAMLIGPYETVEAVSRAGKEALKQLSPLRVNSAGCYPARRYIFVRWKKRVNLVRRGNQLR